MPAQVEKRLEQGNCGRVGGRGGRGIGGRSAKAASASAVELRRESTCGKGSTAPW